MGTVQETPALGGHGSSLLGQQSADRSQQKCSRMACVFTEGSSTFSWKSEAWDLPKPKNKYPPVTFHILNSDPGLGVLPPLGGSPCPKESDQQLWLVASQEPWHPEDSADTDRLAS